MKNLSIEKMSQVEGGSLDWGLSECNIYWGLAMTASDSISRESYVAAYVSAGCLQ